MKLLIIKLSSIGDCVHTLPAFYALRKGLKRARIDWLVEEAASGVLKDNPLIDNLVVVKKWSAGNLKENLKTARQLAAEQYDMVLDFQGLIKSGAWVFLTKGRRRIGFSNSRELSHLFLNEKLPAYDPERHAVDRYLDLARYAGGNTREVVFPIVTEEALKSVRRKLKGGGLPEGLSYFVLIPRARWATKLWSDEKFALLARRLTEKTGMRAVLAGGPSDKAALGQMKEKIGEGAIDLAGGTDLKELAALLKAAALVVTVDSGPMHIAAAVGARVAAIFGPTAPWRTGPYGGGHIIIRKGFDCSPCFRKKCSTLRCMKDISVEEVMAAIEGMLAAK